MKKAYKPFNERMRNRRVWNRLDLLDREDAQVGQPTMETVEIASFAVQLYKPPAISLKCAKAKQ
jgi:hypothetical protein